MSIDRLSSKNLIESEMLWESLISNNAFVSFVDYSLKQRISWVKLNMNFKDKKVLNVGSGQGYLEKTLIKKNFPASIFVSLDISRKSLEKISKYNKNHILGFIESLPFVSEAFDTIICMEVIEHLSKKQVKRALGELSRILKSGGEAVISVPVYEQAAIKSHLVGHLRKYVPNEVMSEIINEGFSIIQEYRLFPFSRMNLLFSWLAKTFHLRRPSVIIFHCRKP